MQLDILTRIRLLSQHLDRTFTAATDTKLQGVAIGQKVMALVDQKLPDGNFKVLIGNQPLQMSLPQGTTAGARLELVLVSREPRLTFTLPQPPQERPSATLSDGAKLLSTLRAPPGEPTVPLTSPKPVLPAPPFDVKQLATALQTTLSQSGLFYESHQAQWVSGQKPLTEILQEPQGKLSSAPMPAENPPKEGASTSVATKATLPAAADKPAAALDAAKITAPAPFIADAPQRSDSPGTINTAAAPTSASAPPDIAAQGGSVRETVHSDMLPIVRQQLDALDSRQISWSGQVWPGQSMDWEIDEQGGGGPSAEANRTWRSKLHLVLPNLGDVTATLQLGQAGVQISVKAQDAETQNRLRAGIRTLSQSLEETGIRMLSMKVGSDGA